MKIAYLLRFWPVYGGGETVTRALVNELADRGHDIYVIYFWNRDNNMRVELNKNVHTILLHDIINLKDGDIDRKQYPFIEKQLSKIFNDYKFDIVVNQWMPNRQVYHALAETNTKLIKCHHGVVKYVPVIKTLKQKLFYGLLKNSGGWIRVYWQFRDDYRLSDKWVMLSNYFVEDAKKLYRNADEKKICAISNPLPYKVDINDIDLKEKCKEIVYVGRMIELKRVHYLLKAWSIIENDNNVRDWTFRLIGDGVTLQDEKKYAAELNCKRVVFEGFQNAQPYLKKAALLVMASVSEGFGMVLVEAQQYGCVPVVVDSFSTVHDIIQTGRNGILVEDNNIEAFSRALSTLISDSDKREEMARNAMVDCGKFSVKNIVDQWEKLFNEVLA